MKNPKLFISYSQTDTSHKKWVLNLAVQLRDNGVDVILDEWDLKVGHEMYAFMEQMVTDPNIKKVAVVCDKTYTKKANARLGGVGNEVELMVNHIANDSTQQKFAALVCEKDRSGVNYIPTYLQSRLYIDFTNKDSFAQMYQQLLYWVFDRDHIEKPPLGRIPDNLKARNIDRTLTPEPGPLETGKFPGRFTLITDFIITQYNNAKTFKLNKTKMSLPDKKTMASKTNDSQSEQYDGASLLPSCFENSEILLDKIIYSFENIDNSDNILERYLNAICQAFAASSCIYINDTGKYQSSKKGGLSNKNNKIIKDEYGELFNQNVTFGISRSRSSAIKNNSIYIPLTFDNIPTKHKAIGLLIMGVGKSVKVDDSVRIVLSSIFDGSNQFQNKLNRSEICIVTYDNFKNIYNFVSEKMYESRFLYFKEQLSSVDIHFEPIVEFSHSGKLFNIYGFEALARVNERVPIYLFEAAELWGVRFQTELDIYVLKRSLTKYLNLLEETKRLSYHDLMTLSINVYPNTILRKAYHTALYDILEKLKFPGQKLILELSEKGVIYAGDQEDGHLDVFIKAKEELKQKKVKIAIDDFGTGSSSILRVQKIMPDFVKIDRQILLYQSKIAKELIGQLVSLKDESHNRMFGIVVEGLDEETNLNISISELVNELEVDYIQGHLLGKASDDTPKRLNKEKHEEIKQLLDWA